MSVSELIFRADGAAEYPVFIGEGTLERLPSLLNTLNAGNVAVVLDRGAGERAAELVSAEIPAEMTASFISLDGGESIKTPETLFELCEHYAELHLCRSDIVIAVGGGAVTDTVGLAAAIYMRGIRYINIPTTLVCAADASVGGKTAVNLSAGKNLVGVFHQPSAVICDTRLLATLDRTEYACGMAEIIKCAVIEGGDFFESVKAGSAPLDFMISQSLELKSRLVAADTFDRGERRLLNLGHTFGHAAEVCSGRTLSHGMAVAAGIMTAARISVRLGLANPDLPEDIAAILSRERLPLRLGYHAADLLNAIHLDKKSEHGGSESLITTVLPAAPGACHVVSFTYDRIADFADLL